MKIFILLCMILGLASCVAQPSSDQVQRDAQEKLSQQSNMSVGMPAIVNFQEKRMLKQIYELRDQAIVTITYIIDMNGNLHKFCDSIGYGVPYATEYTNPMRVTGGINTPSTGNVSIPQADPNGLFSPASAEGTWVLCKDPNSTKVAPVYVEPRIIVSQFALNGANSLPLTLGK